MGLLPKSKKLALVLETCTIERVWIRAGPRGCGIQHLALGRPRDAGGHLAAGPHVRLPPRCTDPAGGTSQGGGGSSRREQHPHQLRGCSRRRLGRPSPQSVPELHSLAPRASAETAGRQGHPELDVTKPSLGPSRRGLLPPRPSAAPASAMAPGMSGRRGAALLCLSALLAHGKCCGADSGVKMRRSPLEGHRGYWRKANPTPDSQPPLLAWHLRLQLELPPSPKPFGGS